MNKSVIKTSIPNGWIKSKLSDISKVKMGQSPPSSTYNQENRGIPFFQGNADFGFIYPSIKIWCDSPTRIASHNDILISVRAPVGAINISNIKCCIGRGLSAIEVNNGYDMKYIYFYLNYFNRLFRRLEQGSTFPAINKKDLFNFPIILPKKLEEQQKITFYLINVDDLIQTTEKIIEKLKVLKRGLMQQLFTKGIGHTEFKDFKGMGNIPEEWEIHKLGNITEILDSQRIPLSSEVRKNKKGIYPYCGANGIIDYIDKYIFNGEFLLLAEDGGSYGPFEESAYIMNGKFWVNNHAHILKADENLSSNKFLLYILNYLNLTPYIVGSTRVKLNQTDLKQIKIPIPKINEQDRIVESLESIDNLIKLNNNYQNKFSKIKKGLMQVLLTGKKRVPLS